MSDEELAAWLRKSIKKTSETLYSPSTNQRLVSAMLSATLGALESGRLDGLYDQVAAWMWPNATGDE